MSVTPRVAEYGASLSWERVPEAVREKTRASLLDALACAAAGRKTAEFAALERTLALAGERGAGSRALLDAFAVHVLEYDDAHKRSKTHPGAVVVPAVLQTAALAGAPAHRQLAAIVAGYEIMLRLGIALGAAEHRRAGWHATATTGAIGAAVAAARVLDLDADGIAQAMGHAVGLASGNWAFLAGDSDTKAFQVANAARAGVLSALAAQNGLRAATHALEARDGGFFALFGGDANDALRDLDRFLMPEVATKPYPCCRTVQAGIDAVFALRPIDGPIHVKTFGICVEQNGFYSDGAAGQAAFSLPLIIAAAARDGRVDFETFSPATVASLREAERNVTWEVDSALDAMYPEKWAATVVAGGRTKTVEYALGDPLNPMDERAYARKLEACAGSDGAALRAQVDSLFTTADSELAVSSI
ncbi:MAG: MmgE/PrpD family protein [Candidatus Eremiobacteraeota bacterium]|nr:MmgE/PrpD family protein [Candidatus Eremiobacteraeota bacterium]